MSKRHQLTIAAAVGGLLITASASLAAPPGRVRIGSDDKVFPESMAATPDGTLYAGSIAEGIVFKAAPGTAQAAPFIARQAGGPQSVLGVYADPKAGLLWVCYSDLSAMNGKPGAPGAIVRSFDLASGALKASYPFPGGGFCNDVTTAAAGTAYVSDTAGGRVLRLKPGATDLDVWFKDDGLKGIDGLSLGPDGALYVNSVTANTLGRVDINADGSAKGYTKLTLSQPIKGPDGMRFGDDGVLYLAENGAGEADAVTLSGDNATIKPFKTGLDAPTGVGKAGNTLFVLEAKVDQMGKATDPGPFYVYTAPLQ